MLRPQLVSVDLVAPRSPSPGAGGGLSRVTGPGDPPWTLLSIWGRRQSCGRIERLWSVGRQDGFSSRTRVFITRPSEGQRATAETVSLMWGGRGRNRSNSRYKSGETGGSVRSDFDLLLYILCCI